MRRLAGHLLALGHEDFGVHLRAARAVPNVCFWLPAAVQGLAELNNRDGFYLKQRRSPVGRQ
jgi:hypothetical protein